MFLFQDYSKYPIRILFDFFCNRKRKAMGVNLNDFNEIRECP